MTPQDRDKVIGALKHEFGTDHVEAEPIGPNGRYRFAVVSAQFSDMPQLERQDSVWAVIDKVLPREAILDVSLILAFAPNELERAV